MIPRVLAGVAAGLILAAATQAGAAATPTTKSDQRLQKLLAGRVAGAPKTCIRPDFSARPEIFEGAGIVYRDGRTTYLATMAGGCPALRESRTIITRTQAGSICRNDPVRIVEPTGADFGFCTFSGFTPYTKPRD